LKAVILAAGRGTRLGSLTSDIPKPMIRIAGAPALEHIIIRIKRAGVSDIALVVRYKAEKIMEHFEDGSRLGVHIEYVRQPETYGTAAALLAAGDCAGDSPVITTFGDVVTAGINYRDSLRVFAERGSAGVITVNKVPDAYAGSDVRLGPDDRVLEVVEKPLETGVEYRWNCSGIYVFGPVVFEYLERLQPSARGEYELADAMNAMISDGLALHASYLRGFWRDIGTVEGIADAQKMLSEDVG